MDEFDKALEYLDAPSTPTATPSATTETSSATTATPSISEVNNHNVDVIIGALKDLNVDVSKGEEGVLKGTMKGWKRARAISGSDASAPTIYTSRSTEANKKDEARKAASNRKREARRAALAAYEKERCKEQLNEQPNKQPEVKKKRSFFPSRRKSAPAGSLNAPVSPLSVPVSSSELDLKKIDELEWRSFNTWVVDLTSDLKNFSISFNQIVSKKRKKFEVEPLKNDETYNPYNPVYVIHYFKDFWDKIKGFYGAEKVELEPGNVKDFIDTIDNENWEKYGWENPEFSTNSKAKEPELNKNNKVIKAFEGWLKIIKKNVTNLQDKIGKENIENNKEYKGIDDESVNELWQDYGRYIEEYNKFVKDQNRLVDEQKKDKILSTLIDANDRKSREIRERIVNPIFSNGEFENLTPADLLKNFSDKKAPECKERGQLVGKYERLKAILYDAEMIEGAGGLCKCLYDFHKGVSLGSKISPMAKVLNQRTKNIRGCFVDPKRAVELAGSFEDLLGAINDSIDKLRGVYNNVQGALSGDASIIGKDYDFIFGRDEKNCWHVYQNETGVEKEIGSIAEVYYKVVKKDGKQEKNAYLRDLNGKVTLYDKAFIYGRLSSYLCGSMGYLSFENNFTPNGEIECYYTDEEGKENSVTFNANGMAIKINRQGEEMKVNENSNAFKQLEQAFEGNQLSSTSPQGDLDINNNEKNEGGINMAGDESKEVTGKWTKAKPSGEKSGEDMIGTSRFLENQVRGTLNKYNRFAENYSKFVEDYNGFVDGLKSSDDLKNLITKVLKKEPEENSIWLNGDERNLTPEPGKTFNTIEELNKAWVDLINKLAEYLPEDNIAAYAGEVTKISRAIISDNDIDNSEKLKLMEKYNKMCDKMLNYTNSVLKRLEKGAKYEDPIEDDEEKSKGFFDKVKGKASKLVRKDKKVVAHKLDNSEKELDAAPKERKVADNYAGTNGTNVRFVKQSVMDQPEYAAFKAVGQVISNNSGLGNLLGISSKFNSDDSSLKQFQSKLKDALKGNSLYKWRAEKDNEATGDTVLGVMFIGIAYLPSGSKGIEAACKGLSVGGIKGYNGTIGEAHKLMRAMKKGTRKGLEGHNLVKDPDVKEGLKYFVNEDSIPKIESKFSTLLKLKRKAAKLGSKAKETAKKAATKIGKSSVGRAAKSAATTAGGGIKSAARSVKKGILKRIKGSKSKKDSVKQETGVIDLEKPNNRKKSSFWVKEDE